MLARTVSVTVQMLHSGFSQFDQDISSRWLWHVQLDHLRRQLSGLVEDDGLVLGGECVSHGRSYLYPAAVDLG